MQAVEGGVMLKGYDYICYVAQAIKSERKMFNLQM